MQIAIFTVCSVVVALRSCGVERQESLVTGKRLMWRLVSRYMFERGVKSSAIAVPIALRNL